MEKILRMVFGTVLAIAAIAGVILSLVLAFATDIPGHGDPWIMLPYGVVLLGGAAVLLIRSYEGG